MADRVIFLPGASGDGTFWAPVAERLQHPADKVLLEWFGFGNVPSSPGVRELDDLLALVRAHIDRPVDLVAQSMGGMLAIRAALERPPLIHHLVLTATSGGIDVARFNPQDWRESYRREYAGALPGFVDDRTDLSARLPLIQAATLLIWGDADPISPVAIGEYLASILPRSKLVIIKGGGHALGKDRVDEVAPLIAGHLSADF